MRLRRWPTASVMLLIALVGITALRRMSDSGPSAADVILDDGPHVVARAVDGDTLLLVGGHRVRLIGVDTPETKHPDRPVEVLGPEASQFTRSLTAGESVRLVFDRQRRDDYHRLLAYVYLPDDRLLNEELIRAGFSRAETRFPYRQDMKRLFLAAEEEARQARRGLWSTPPAVAE